MKVPVLGKLIDERFLTHRLRSTSIAGMAGVTVAMGLFIYRNSHDHIWSWDLIAVGLTMASAKIAAMIWYRVTD
jgi:hypothetical protein